MLTLYWKGDDDKKPERFETIPAKKLQQSDGSSISNGGTNNIPVACVVLVLLSA